MSHSLSPTNRGSIFGWVKNLKRSNLLSNESLNDTSDLELAPTDSRLPTKSAHRELLFAHQPEFLRPILHHRPRLTNDGSRARSGSWLPSEKLTTIRMRRDLFLSSNPLVDNDSAYFGVPLGVALKEASAKISILTPEDSDAGLSYGEIPVVVAKCGVFLKNNGLNVEGIFRVGGRLKRLKELQLIFNTGPEYGRHMLWDGYTVHDAASILRRYLNALPEPLIPLDFYQRFREPIESRRRIVRYMSGRADRIMEGRATPPIALNDECDPTPVKNESPRLSQQPGPSKESQTNGPAPESLVPATQQDSLQNSVIPHTNDKGDTLSNALISPTPSNKINSAPVPVPVAQVAPAVDESSSLSNAKLQPALKGMTSDDADDAAFSLSGSPPLVASKGSVEHGQPLTEANITRLNVGGLVCYNNMHESCTQSCHAPKADCPPEDSSQVHDPARPSKKHHSYKKLARDVREALEEYKILVDELPHHSKQLLFYILDLLAMVQTNADENLMSARNLAAIFQPSVLSHPDHDMDPDEYALSQLVVEFLIQYAYKLLPEQPCEPLPLPPMPESLPETPLSSYQDPQAPSAPLSNILGLLQLSQEFETTDAESEISDLRDVPPASKLASLPNLPLLRAPVDLREVHSHPRSRSSTFGKVEIHISAPQTTSMAETDTPAVISASL